MSDQRAQSGRVALSAPVAFFRGSQAAAAPCPYLGPGNAEGSAGDSAGGAAGSAAGGGGRADPERGANILIAAYDEGNRCRAYGAPIPLGRLQQELVCLTVAHRTCPRYERGIRFGRAGPRRLRRLPSFVGPIVSVLAVVVLVAALTAGGRLDVAPLTAFLGAVPSSPGATVTPAATASPSATGTPTPQPTPSPTPEPTPAPTPTAAPTLAPPPPGSAYATLAPCPDGELCYLYTVRNGDTLYAIARGVGTTVGAIRALNPAVADTDLIRPGQVLKLPPP